MCSVSSIWNLSFYGFSRFNLGSFHGDRSYLFERKKRLLIFCLCFVFFYFRKTMLWGVLSIKY